MPSPIPGNKKGNNQNDHKKASLGATHSEAQFRVDLALLTGTGAGPRGLRDALVSGTRPTTPTRDGRAERGRRSGAPVAGKGRAQDALPQPVARTLTQLNPKQKEIDMRHSDPSHFPIHALSNNTTHIKEKIMKTQNSFQFVTRFIFLAVLALCVAAATSSAKAGVSVGTPGDSVADSPVEVSFDMVDLLEEEQSLLESLAGGSQFEVLGGWEVGSGPGQKSAEIVVDDVDVTSADGRSFILYVVDEEGEESSLDVVVQDDGVLSVYDPATDSEAYFSPFVTEPEVVTSVKPNWGARKPRPSRYAADSGKKKKKKKKKPGPRNPRPKPEPEPEPEPDREDDCSDCPEGTVCIESGLGVTCYDPIFEESRL